MEQVIENINIDQLKETDKEVFMNISLEVSDHKQRLLEEVMRLQSEFVNQHHESFSSSFV